MPEGVPKRALLRQPVSKERFSVRLRLEHPQSGIMQITGIEISRQAKNTRMHPFGYTRVFLIFVYIRTLLIFFYSRWTFSFSKATQALSPTL